MRRNNNLAVAGTLAVFCLGAYAYTAKVVACMNVDTEVKQS